MADFELLQALSYSALERLQVPRPVDRVGYIAQQVKSKFVLDLGALDETAFDAKSGTNAWLHGRICLNASRVIGIDNSPLLPEEGLDTQNGGRIIHGDIFKLGLVVQDHGRPDIVVAGELVEHLADTLSFLRALKATPELRGVEFVFSTPNACCLHNVLVGLAGRESMHADHLQVYSYKVLRTLFSRADIELSSLVPTYARFPEMIGKSRGIKKAVAALFQSGVNGLEFLFPLLSGGWVGRARI